MYLGGKKVSECEVCVNGIRLEHFSDFKYLGVCLDESGTYEAEFSRKVASERRDAGLIKSLVNVRNLQIECARGLYESLLVPVFTYGSETEIRREKKSSRNITPYIPASSKTSQIFKFRDML